MRNPVTEALRQIRQERKQFLEMNRRQCFVRGDQPATYDNHVEIEARLAEWEDEAEALRSIESFMQEAEDVGKYEWDISGGIQDSNQA